MMHTVDIFIMFIEFKLSVDMFESFCNYEQPNQWYFINSHEFIYSHCEVSKRNSLLYSGSVASQAIGGTRNTSCAIWCLEIKAFFTTKCCMMVGKQLPLAEVYRSLIWVPWIRGTCYKLGALSVIWRQGKPLETILIIFKSIFERGASLIWSVFYMICPVCHILTWF